MDTGQLFEAPPRPGCRRWSTPALPRATRSPWCSRCARTAAGDPRLCLPPPTGLTGGYAGLLRTFGGRPVYGLQCRGLRGEGGLPGSPAELVTAVAVPRGRGSHRAS
ncbi:hypothetical protein [Amycolatopsis tolypomycina]|uniref:hypothetical protein n=1 Tax=Amycolatopsis tolypomycina TaxID=208445 RepID=UPI0033BD3424